MYRVFINDRMLLISDRPDKRIERNLKYEGSHAFSIAEGILLDRQAREINVFDYNAEKIWNEFKERYKSIEAAGGIVFNEKGDILMIRRHSKWDLPKGKIEKAETPEQAALREVQEETGLSELEIHKPASTTYHTYLLEGEAILKPTHWFYIKNEGLQKTVPQRCEQIEKVSWMDKAQIKEALTDTYANIKSLLTPLI